MWRFFFCAEKAFPGGKKNSSHCEGPGKSTRLGFVVIQQKRNTQCGTRLLKKLERMIKLYSQVCLHEVAGGCGS